MSPRGKMGTKAGRVERNREFQNALRTRKRIRRTRRLAQESKRAIDAAHTYDLYPKRNILSEGVDDLLKDVPKVQVHPILGFGRKMLEDANTKDLRQRALSMGLPAKTRMKKAELIDLIWNAR